MRNVNDLSVEHKHVVYISYEVCMRLELKNWLLGEGHHLARGCLVLLIPSLFGKQMETFCLPQKTSQSFSL